MHTCTVTCDTCGHQTVVHTREQTYTAAIYELPESWVVRWGLTFCGKACFKSHSQKISDDLTYMGAA